MAENGKRCNGTDLTAKNINNNSNVSAKNALHTQHKTLIAAAIHQNVEEPQGIEVRETTASQVSDKSVNKTGKLNSSQAPILPSLTDDMFVVEAPSFIVPYVYEKPSIKPFREFVDSLEKELKEKSKEKSEKQQNGKDDGSNEGKDEGDEKMDVDEENDSQSPDEDIEKDDEKADKTETEEKEHKDENEEVVNEQVPEKKKRRRRKEEQDDDWDGSSDDSECDVISEDSDTEIIKDNDSIESVDLKEAITDLSVERKIGPKTDSYFDCSLGQFYIDIGMSLVQEFVQTDLLKVQNKKLYKEKKMGAKTRATETAISGLLKNLEYVKNKNVHFTHKMHRCEFCNFKSESMIILSHHLETPHMKNNIYQCNFCNFEIRSPHDILYHMEVLHNVRGRLERAPAYHQCSNCPYEDNGKGKLARHIVACAKRFKPEINLGPPSEWEPPAKIPKIVKPKNNIPGSYPLMNKSQIPIANSGVNNAIAMQSQLIPYKPQRGRPPMSLNQAHGTPLMRGGLMVRYNTPNPLQNNSQIRINPLNKNAMKLPKGLNHQPSISITPLPRQPIPIQVQTTPNQQTKGNFVICEICDGYIKDLEQLRNHMQWIHKVKIHPKMIYNRPPLNCQKCLCRFFTDQGLERHLLGSHGLVTSSMQEAANTGKDSGRCPVCGRVYQRKLLNHVASDHNLTLKPAHLSYKCTVCTATFGLYKKFENHVYSAHSVVAKREIDRRPKPVSTANNSNDSLLKPLKISDEITIIPQPAKSNN